MKTKFDNLFDIDFETFKNIKKEFPEYGYLWHLEGDITPKKNRRNKEEPRTKLTKFGLSINEFMKRIQKYV